MQASVNAGGYSYAYDRYGNRLQQNPSSQSGMAPQLMFSTSTNQMVGNGISYDAAGNMLSDGLNNTYQYDAEGNMISSSGFQFSYDSLNEQIGVSSNEFNNASEYVLDPWGKVASVWQVNVFNGNGSQGNFELDGTAYWGSTPIDGYPPNSTSHFRYRDWLGSLRMETDAQGTVTLNRTNLAFGDSATNTLGSRDVSFDGFAGYWDGATSDTNHAPFREYSNLAGRWMSPDPYDGSYRPMNPQSLNRYSYVLNNPLSFTDQTGLVCSVVVGGITQSPNTAGTSAQQQFASSIGAIQAFPYAGGSTLGGVLSVGAQAQGANTAATYVAAAAFTAAAQGGPFNIFTFSGGAQATIAALNLVSPGVRGLVNNITMLSPGVAGSVLGGGAQLPYGTGATTVLQGNSFIDSLADQGSLTGGSTGCPHSANCAFTNNSAFLHTMAGGGSGCNTQAVFTPRGASGGIQVDSTNYSGAFLFLYYGGDTTTVTTTQVDSILIP
jgi:RHS repeat-associated protein